MADLVKQLIFECHISCNIKDVVSIRVLLVIYMKEKKDIFVG